ncbi:hypothetical protein BaRGS_00023455 [Batillaria attramentaria]|uniref:Uncharacterized protein n=1 Tax=Batillaria attramentaria TaxID=370345 RepID=A0ABD0KE13_9CAEN
MSCQLRVAPSRLLTLSARWWHVDTRAVSTSKLTFDVWAKLLLLYVCVLACLLIGPSLSLRDNEETKFEKSLMGGEHLCYISGDPHLHGFGGASADVDLPCSFRAAKFVTKNVRGVSSRASCTIHVNATNQFLDGRYVVSSVNIRVGLDDAAHEHHNSFDVYKTFNYSMNDSTIYNVRMNKHL